MNLRAKIVLYLVAIHAILGAVVVFVLIDRPWLLFAFEALFTLSGLLGYMMIRAFFVPLGLIRTGAQLMRERDFTTRFSTVGQPEMDELIGVYNGMADQLKAERLKLEEQNLFLERVLAASPAGVVTLDHDGRVSQVNPGAARLIGLAADALIGRRLESVGSPVTLAMADLGSGRSVLVSPDGRRRLRCQRAEFFDRGAPRAFFVIEELTDELRESERVAYGKVIRLMSHEVNNSIGAVRSLLESCRTYGRQLGAEDRSDFDSALEVASGRLDRLNGFMRDLASVARVPVPDRRPCDLAALVADVARLLAPELERLRIVLEQEFDATLPPIDLDKNQIEQVLLNALRNAIEAIGEGGRIALRVGRAQGRFHVSIHDSGPGIADDVRTRLFTPFFSTKREGQGLGLTLSREILALHGFEFSLENHRDGGAEFMIRGPLPI